MQSGELPDSSFPQTMPVKGVIMNEKEIAEIRRCFRSDKSNITHIRGCYVSEKGEILSQLDQPLSLMSQEETDELLAILRRTLSGVPEKNLLDIPFSTEQVAGSEEHALLMALRDSALKNDEAVQAFFQKVIQSLTLEGQYLILLVHDTYDVPYRSKDGDRQYEASSEVYSYILCSICPVKITKPALSYYMYENAFHTCKTDWLVAPPALGFLFPAFDDRSTNLYSTLYYTRDTAEIHEEFVKTLFRQEPPMPAAVQKETFQSLLGDTLADDCSYEVVQAVHDQLYAAIEEHKANREEDPPAVSKAKFKQVLTSCGVDDTHMAAFEEKYNNCFGEDAELNARNIADTRRMEVCTPDVTIHVKAERSDLVETRVINGIKYILIRADEGVEVNGVHIHIT